MLPEADVLPAQALLLPNAGRDQIVPEPMASGDYNVPEHKKLKNEVVKVITEEIVFTMTSWLTIYDEKYSMVDEAWILAIEPQDCQRALAGAPVDTPSVRPLPGGPSFKINLQT